MSDTSVQELLNRLTGRGGDQPGADSWAKVAGTTPDHDRVKSAAVAQVEKEREGKLNQLLGRIAKMGGPSEEGAAAVEEEETAYQ